MAVGRLAIFLSQYRYTVVQWDTHMQKAEDIMQGYCEESDILLAISDVRRAILYLRQGGDLNQTSLTAPFPIPLQRLRCNTSFSS